MLNGVKAKCRLCGCLAPADQFRLHLEQKQMVCPKCYSGKPKEKRGFEGRAEVKEKKVVPPGWDADDEYLIKASSKKQLVVQGEFKHIPGTNQVRYTCINCKFNFRYDPFRKRPHSCPYCDTAIPRLKTFSML